MERERLILSPPFPPLCFAPAAPPVLTALPTLLSVGIYPSSKAHLSHLKIFMIVSA